MHLITLQQRKKVLLQGKNNIQINLNYAHKTEIETSKLRTTVPYQDCKRKTRGMVRFSNREPLKDAPRIQSIILSILFFVWILVGKNHNL